MGRRAPDNQIDWELIEKEFRLGQFSLRQIAATHKVQPSAISRRAARLGWERVGRLKETVALSPLKDEFDRSGFVYVIYIDDSASQRFYKIGMAAVFTSRFESHQCSSPFRICVACAYFVGNMRAEERELHIQFADKNVRGEWFDLNDEDLQAIAKRAKLV